MQRESWSGVSFLEVMTCSKFLACVKKSEYTLTPSHPMLDLKLFNPQLLNKDGAYIEQLEYNDDGTLLLTPRLPEDVAAIASARQARFPKRHARGI